MNKESNKCSGCSQKDRCSQVYEKLGQVKGPGVLRHVIFAFLAPIFIFILTLAGTDRLLRDRFEGKLLTIAGFAIALAVTLVFIVLIWAIRRPFEKISKIND